MSAIGEFNINLLQFDTVSASPRERDSADFAGTMLEEWGVWLSVTSTSRGARV